ncbi:MAG TPA: hypothetical protein PKW50_08570, partial [Syntrophomonas sp.]|nr:hypothetical protein [Syntrophomonas sp.]
MTGNKHYFCRKNRKIMVEARLSVAITEAIASLYSIDTENSQIQLQKTRREFEGDFTLVVFPVTKISRKAPEVTATEIGNYLIANLQEVHSFNVIKGFLNILLKDSFWLQFLSGNRLETEFGF